MCVGWVGGCGMDSRPLTARVIARPTGFLVALPSNVVESASTVSCVCEHDFIDFHRERCRISSGVFSVPSWNVSLTFVQWGCHPIQVAVSSVVAIASRVRVNEAWRRRQTVTPGSRDTGVFCTFTAGTTPVSKEKIVFDKVRLGEVMFVRQLLVWLLLVRQTLCCVMTAAY